MTERLTAGTFEAARDTVFEAAAGDATVPLTLRVVRERDQDVPGAPEGWRAFTLEFEGPEDAPLPQATYRLANDATGELDVFIVPVGRDASGFRYEAVFG